ncbi:TPA: hypothetical protein JG946_003745 [Enterobacter hormaechei subsp. steigerwaltii]|nr:hypothetical protein [Enterobacter hormaechei subsp. steigerwaltii]
MKLKIKNNNPNNFKAELEVDGSVLYLQMSNVNDTYIRINPARITCQLLKNGVIHTIQGEIRQHLMTEEEQFQDLLLDPLSTQKLYVGKIYTAYLANDRMMTEELLRETLAVQEDVEPAKTKKRK